MSYNKEAVQKLEFATIHLWRVARCWNGVADIQIETGDAIYFIKRNIEDAPPKSAVVRQSQKLLDELIRGFGSQPQVDSSLINFPDILDAQEA